MRDVTSLFSVRITAIMHNTAFRVFRMRFIMIYCSSHYIDTSNELTFVYGSRFAEIVKLSMCDGLAL